MKFLYQSRKVDTKNNSFQISFSKVDTGHIFTEYVFSKVDTTGIIQLFSFSEVDTVSECAFSRRFCTNLGFSESVREAKVFFRSNSPL